MGIKVGRESYRQAYGVCNCVLGRESERLLLSSALSKQHLIAVDNKVLREKTAYLLIGYLAKASSKYAHN